MTETKNTRGGARKGAGRPATGIKPIMTTIKFKDQAQKDKYLALGGNTWIKKMIDAHNHKY